eukprot:1159883-Pelagomonas_calceolata.AAC.7
MLAYKLGCKGLGGEREPKKVALLPGNLLLLICGTLAETAVWEVETSLLQRSDYGMIWTPPVSCRVSKMSDPGSHFYLLGSCKQYCN